MTTAVRESTLGEVGDLKAEPGSRDWAIAVRIDIRTTLNDVKGDAKHLDVMLSLMRQHHGYRQLTNRRGKPFNSYEAFCVEPQPFGLGYRTDDIDRIIGERRDRTARDLAEKVEPEPPHGGSREGAGRKPQEPIDDSLPLMALGVRQSNQGSNVTLISERGNRGEYLAARIARDRPDILERMKAGEFTSVRKAALEAGIITPEFSIPVDPQGAARRILNRFQGEPLVELLRVLANHAGYDLAEK